MYHICPPSRSAPGDSLVAVEAPTSLRAPACVDVDIPLVDHRATVDPGPNNRTIVLDEIGNPSIGADYAGHELLGPLFETYCRRFRPALDDVTPKQCAALMIGFATLIHDGRSGDQGYQYAIFSSSLDRKAFAECVKSQIDPYDWVNTRLEGQAGRGWIEAMNRWREVLLRDPQVATDMSLGVAVSADSEGTTLAMRNYATPWRMATTAARSIVTVCTGTASLITEAAVRLCLIRSSGFYWKSDPPEKTILKFVERTLANAEVDATPVDKELHAIRSWHTMVGRSRWCDYMVTTASAVAGVSNLFSLLNVFPKTVETVLVISGVATGLLFALKTSFVAGNTDAEKSRDFLIRGAEKALFDFKRRLDNYLSP